MKFEITKANGTVLTKEVDANDKDYIKKLKIKNTQKITVDK